MQTDRVKKVLIESYIAAAYRRQAAVKKHYAIDYRRIEQIRIEEEIEKNETEMDEIYNQIIELEQ